METLKKANLFLDVPVLICPPMPNSKQVNNKSYSEVLNKEELEALCTSVKYFDNVPDDFEKTADYINKNKDSNGWFTLAEFKDNIRRQENCISKTGVLVDVDEVIKKDTREVVTDYDISNLNEFSYYAIITTSAKNCLFSRFRVIVPFDVKLNCECFDNLEDFKKAFRQCHDDVAKELAQIAEKQGYIFKFDAKLQGIQQFLYTPMSKKGCFQKYITESEKLFSIHKYIFKTDEVTQKRSEKQKTQREKDFDRKIKNAESLKDPHKKTGIIGDICRNNDIADLLIETGMYKQEGKKWLIVGSESKSPGGVILPNHRFFSWHDSDPYKDIYSKENHAICAFDVVRYYILEADKKNPKHLFYETIKWFQENRPCEAYNNYEPNFNSGVKNNINDYVIKFLESRNIEYKIKSDEIIFCCQVCGDADYQNTLCPKTLLITTQSNDCKDNIHAKRFRQMERELKTLRTRAEKEEASKKRTLLSEHNLNNDNYKDFVRDKNFQIYKYEPNDRCYRIISNLKEWENTIYNANGGILKRTEYRDIEGQVRNTLVIKEDSKSNLLNVNNGLVDIMTGEILPYDRDMFFKYSIPFDYDPKANSGLLYDTVCQILGENEIIELKKMLGYILHKTTKFDKHFIFKGTKGGSNGKGTLLGLISGDNIYHGLFRHLGVDSRIDRLNDPFGLNVIKDKHFLIDKDIEEGYWDKTGIIKKMASGEPLDFRDPHTGNTYSMATHCKIIVATNSDPKVRGGDGGFWRRWKIFNCDKKFRGDKLNTKLKERLNTSEVYSTLLNYAIEGYRMVEDFNQNGDFFKENKEALNEWRRGSDNILLFIEDHCKLDPKCKIRSSHLYRIFKNYLNENGLKQVSARKLNTYLRENYNIGTKILGGYPTSIGIDLDKDRPIDWGNTPSEW
jgi:P4 family phage/plasmid primase-like protien